MSATSVWIRTTDKYIKKGRYTVSSCPRIFDIDFTMADAHLEKNTTSLHEDIKSDNTRTVAEHGHAATDMYDFIVH